MERCGWVGLEQIYVDYHDTDWGVPEYDSPALWEKLQNHWETQADVPTFTELSTQISKDLKKEGFRFCGPTIVYAFMEAVGMVNDHIATCPRHAEVAKLIR